MREELLALESFWLSQWMSLLLRDEEEHEKYGPRQDERKPLLPRCLRCCDPGTPVYQAIPVPQINITILSCRAQRPAEGTFPWGAEGALPCPDRRAGQKMELGGGGAGADGSLGGTEQKHAASHPV